MKELPDEKTLLELVALGKDFEQKARETCDLATEIACKWQRRLEDRQAAKQKACEIE